MAVELCRDIFNAVYVNVRGSFIANRYTSNVKSKTVTESTSEDETLNMTSTSEPKTESNVNSSETSVTVTETVKENIERESEEDVVVDIRMELEEKFPFALGAVCSNLATIDRAYREMKGYEEQGEFSEFSLDIGDVFPLSERFAFPCVMFVSSMVLIDIDEKKSDDFYEKYASSVAQIISEIPFKQSGIVEKYPY